MIVIASIIFWLVSGAAGSGLISLDFQDSWRRQFGEDFSGYGWLDDLVFGSILALFGPMTLFFGMIITIRRWRK